MAPSKSLFRPDSSQAQSGGLSLRFKLGVTRPKHKKSLYNRRILSRVKLESFEALLQNSESRHKPSHHIYGLLRIWFPLTLIRGKQAP